LEIKKVGGAVAQRCRSREEGWAKRPHCLVNLVEAARVIDMTRPMNVECW